MEKIIDKFIRNLDYESVNPLYIQIVHEIKRLIAANKFAEGDIIPGEMELCDRYGVSRSTVRQALDLLVEENIITRKRGKGSFINSSKIQRSMNHLYSFTEDMKGIKVKSSSIILEKEVIQGDENICNKLKIPHRSKVFKLKRIRCAENEKILLEETYVPYILCRGIEKEDFSIKSLYEILTNDYEINMEQAREGYEAVILDNNTAKLLEVESGSPAFKINRIAYMYNNHPFEFTNSYVRGDKCNFVVDLKNNTKGVGVEKYMKYKL